MAGSSGSPEGWLEKIVEEKDATAEERSIREINTGIYCVKAPFLVEGLREIGQENAQSEYYLTDLVEIAMRKGLRCSAHIGRRSDRGDGDQHPGRSCRRP